MTAGRPDPNSVAEALVWKIALLALAAPFLVSGIGKAMHFTAAVAEIRHLTDLEPAPAVAASVILIQLIGPALLLVGGRWTRLGAGLLAAFVAAATFVAHAWWSKAGMERFRDFNAFWEHVALIGGLALAWTGARDAALPK
jgi:uncharacterized membrane protein YphA (DoxX/SURF4 family)